MMGLTRLIDMREGDFSLGTAIVVTEFGGHTIDVGGQTPHLNVCMCVMGVNSIHRTGLGSNSPYDFCVI